MIAVLWALCIAHVVASDAVCLVFLKILKKTQRPSTLRIFLLTRGLGPAALALVTYTLLVFLPGHSPAIYLLLLAGVFLLPASLAVSEIATLAECYRTAWRWVARRVLQVRPLQVSVGVLVALATLVSIALPLVEHDALAAAIEARIAVRDASFANYLAIDRPDPESGYLMETFRTPFLQSLYVSFSWLAGGDHLDRLIRTTSPIFGLHCLTLLAFAVRRHRSIRSVDWSLLLLASTPIFFYMMYNNGIDTARLYLSLAGLLWLVELAATGLYRVAAVAGIVSGLSLFCHVLCLPMLVGGGLVFLLTREFRVTRRVAAAAILTSMTLIAGGSFHYLQSTQVEQQIDQTFGAEGIYELARAFRSWSGSGSQKPMEASRDADRSSPGVEPDSNRTESPSPKGGDEAVEEAPREAQRRRGTTQGHAAGPQEPSRGRETSPKVRLPEDVEAPAVMSSPGKGPPARDAEPRLDTRGGLVKPSPLARAVDRHANLLEMRGQGRNPLQRFVFGRLQMFTGVEHFGWIFYFFWVGVVVWFFQKERSVLDRALVVSALLTAFAVLSGIRQLSWSNPRYIATLLPIAAYLGGPVVAAVERRFAAVRWRKVVLITLLLFPVILVTSIRGAKVEITNPGDFYSDFRSLRWVSYGLEHPVEALTAFWNRYFGLRRTLRYFFADPDDQIRHAHDYFAAVFWIRDHLSSDACVLVFRDVRFFYYSNHKGVVWYSPEIDQRKFRLLSSPRDLRRLLREAGITHVLVDDYSTRLPGYADRATGDMLNDPALAQEIYEYGTARVYRLLDEPGPVAVP